MRNFIFILFLLINGMLTSAHACSARNDAGDTCETNCSTGQTASCRNGTGGGSPVCECKDAGNAFTIQQKKTIKDAILKATPPGYILDSINFKKIEQSEKLKPQGSKRGLMPLDVKDVKPGWGCNLCCDNSSHCKLRCDPITCDT